MNPNAQGSGTSTLCPATRQQQVKDFLSVADYPCLGAKSALHKDRIVFAEHPSLDDLSAAPALCERLAAFSDANPDPGALPISFIAMFGGTTDSEDAFEASLWRLLQAMHEHDRAQFQWDVTVGNDPRRSDFSFSIAGRAYFVVGMHPAASRVSRRTPFPCLVFNFHNQFESFKSSGKYTSMQSAIRSRELDLQGSINPVLARYGKASEARQYSGRAVDSSWQCPFRAHPASQEADGE